MQKGLMPLKYAARKYKLPPDWLENEARHGRLSCLLADYQILFDEKKLVRELFNRVKKNIKNELKNSEKEKNYEYRRKTKTADEP
jgi:hypothetical protein